MLLHPATGRKLADDGLVELALGAIVDVLDASLAEPELGLFEKPVESPVFALQALGIDQQAQAFVEGEVDVVGTFRIRSV